MKKTENISPLYLNVLKKYTYIIWLKYCVFQSIMSHKTVNLIHYRLQQLIKQTLLYLDEVKH